MHSDADVLATQIKTWTSSVYEHYKMPPEIVHKVNDIQYIFFFKCSIKAFAHGSTYHSAKHHMKIALWVAWHHQPFSIIQDEELLNISHDLNNQCVTPLWVMVSWDVKEIFQMSQKKVAGILQTLLKDAHFLARHILANFIFVLMAGLHHRVSRAHTSMYLASHLSECLHEYGVKDKVLALIADNASNNKTMVEELNVQGVDEDDEDNVNLEEDTQDNDEGAGGGDKDEDDEIDPAVDASNVEMIEKVLKEIAEEGQLSPLTDEEVQLGQYSIAKLRNLGKKIFNSLVLKTDLKMACIEHNKPCGVQLKHFQLLSKEWDLLDKLYPLLDVFLFAMKKISENKIPLIHDVIPIFNILMTTLEKFIDDRKLCEQQPSMDFLTAPLIQDIILFEGKVFQGAQKYFKALDGTIVDGDPVDDWLNSPLIPLSWCSLPGAIPLVEIVALFKDKSKYLKGKQAEHAFGASEPKVVDVDMVVL
ncbi:hypothetical protein L208DRAFT_1379112 [Tricholoma matsutake]|nr:hypothetical protein L208DRAFT_1379112 [Tricholoma matsutake 945]